MFRISFFKTGRAFVAMVSLVMAASIVHAEDSSLWHKFVEFFSPSSEVQGDGPLYDELRELDRKIHRIEGKYARERRPMTKDRYKKELAQLKKDREELVKKIEAQKNSSSSVKVSSSSKPASSSAKAVSSSSQPVSSSVEVSSSSEAVSSSSENVLAEVAVAETVAACKPDTVYVRDTVVVHDTLYVMLAPKPEPAAEKSSK